MKVPHIIILIICMIFSIFAKNEITYSASKQNICIVDISLIFQQSNAEIDAKSSLELRQQEMEKTLNKIGKEIDELNESLQRESIVMNKKSITEKRREIRIRFNDLKDLKVKFQEELDSLQKKLVLEIENDIVTMISRIGETKGYQLVINKSAILYANKSIDITNEVLEKYNLEYSNSKK